MDGTSEGFQKLLADAVHFHGHLCGGQILGVRMAMAGLRELEIGNSRGEEGRDLVIFVEIDRCVTDAIISVTGRTPGKRSIKMMDYGKAAATFVETRTGRAVRVSVRGDSGARIKEIAKTFRSRHDEKHADLEALKSITEADLLRIEKVRVELRPEDLPGESLGEVRCQACGETVRDLREVRHEGRVLCKPCAREGSNYYTVYH
ncbi:MAG: FmdE family protein [Pseudomonadota bacterium]